MFLSGYGCSFIAGLASFRIAWGIQFIPALFLMLGLPFLPRSPRWLAKVGRNEEAIRNLANIQAGGNIDDPLVVAEWEEIWTVLAAERESPAGLFGFKKFIYKGMWKRTLAGLSPYSMCSHIFFGAQLWKVLGVKSLGLINICLAPPLKNAARVNIICLLQDHSHTLSRRYTNIIAGHGNNSLAQT